MARRQWVTRINTKPGTIEPVSIWTRPLKKEEDNPTTIAKLLNEGYSIWMEDSLNEVINSCGLSLAHGASDLTGWRIFKSYDL